MIPDTGFGADPHPVLNVGTGPGSLLGALAGVGLEPEDIDIVFLAHCHPDHSAWNLSGELVSM